MDDPADPLFEPPVACEKLRDAPVPASLSCINSDVLLKRDAACLWGGRACRNEVDRGGRAGAERALP